MRRQAARAVFAALVAVTLAACGQAAAVDPDVTVSGPPRERPTLTYVTPLSVDETFRQVVWEGTGAALVDGAPVLLDYLLEDATDASLVRESYSTSPTARLLTEADLGTDLYATIRGQSVGARLLQVAPSDSSGGAGYPTVTVLDILPTRAEGTVVEPPEGLPTVTRADNGTPSLTPTSTDPPDDLVAQPLLRGAGAQVGADDTVTVQYTGYAWTSGEQFDSTWTTGMPVSFSLADVPAWSEGLTEQTVGSQVLLVVPPTYSLGATQSAELSGQTVAFVVDILATRTPSGG